MLPVLMWPVRYTMIFVIRKVGLYDEICFNVICMIYHDITVIPDVRTQAILFFITAIVVLFIAFGTFFALNKTVCCSCPAPLIYS